MWCLTHWWLWHRAEVSRVPLTWTHTTASHHNSLRHHPTKHIAELVQNNDIQLVFSCRAVFPDRSLQQWLSRLALPAAVLPTPRWRQADAEPEGSGTDFAKEVTILPSYALRRQQPLKLPLSLAKRCHHSSIYNMLKQLPTYKKCTNKKIRDRKINLKYLKIMKLKLKIKLCFFIALRYLVLHQICNSPKKHWICIKLNSLYFLPSSLKVMGFRKL